MDWIERWRLPEWLNAFQIALLMVGYDPADISRDSNGHCPPKIYKEINVYLIAVQQAAISNFIESRIAYYDDRFHDNIDWDETNIRIESLARWIKDRGFTDRFFVTQASARMNTSMDSSSPFYSGKLDAALQAWQAVSSNPALLRGKSPKQALEAWLTGSAARFGLVRPDGTPNKQGIEEVAKVANWKPHGGATPTPASAPPSEPTHPVPAAGGQVPQSPSTHQPSPPTSRQDDPSWDDDIPF